MKIWRHQINQWIVWLMFIISGKHARQNICEQQIIRWPYHGDANSTPSQHKNLFRQLIGIYQSAYMGKPIQHPCSTQERLSHILVMRIIYILSVEISTTSNTKHINIQTWIVWTWRCQSNIHASYNVFGQSTFSWLKLRILRRHPYHQKYMTMNI